MRPFPSTASWPLIGLPYALRSAWGIALSFLYSASFFGFSAGSVRNHDNAGSTQSNRFCRGTKSGQVLRILDMLCWTNLIIACTCERQKAAAWGNSHCKLGETIMYGVHSTHDSLMLMTLSGFKAPLNPNLDTWTLDCSMVVCVLCLDMFLPCYLGPWVTSS